jgi:FixJ family two-component response regulator
MLDQHNSTVVVVEDDAGMLKALERLLRAGGFQAVLFSSAEALLGTDAAASAACLVLDIHLPGLSGFELRRRLTVLGHQQPVIFITAVDDEAARDEARQLACIAYFRKPFEGAALLSAIRLALETRP